MRFRLELNQNGDEEIIAAVRRPSELTDKIERLVRESSGDTLLTVYSEERDMFSELDYNRIECVSIIGGKTTVIDSDGCKYISRKRLYELEQMLPECFIRINKSAIANKNGIDRFEAAFSGAVNVIFKSGYSDYVSRRCFSEIRRRIKSE